MQKRRAATACPGPFLHDHRDGVADGRQLADGEVTRNAPSDLLFPPVVSAVTLILATVLSVYKPWGRIRTSGPAAG